MKELKKQSNYLLANLKEKKILKTNLKDKNLFYRKRNDFFYNSS